MENKGGHPKFKPTDEQRSNVEAMTGFGVLHEQMCTLVTNPETGRPISPKTLRRHFKYELARGHTKMIALVADRVFKVAMDAKVLGQRASIASCFFLLKCRGGWSEKTQVEVSGQIVVDMVEVDADKFRSRIARTASRIESAESDSESESS